MKAGLFPEYQFVFPSSADEAEAIEVHNQRWYGAQYEQAVTVPSHQLADGDAPLQSATSDPPNHWRLEQNHHDLPLLPPSTHDPRVGLVELEREACCAADIAAVSGDETLEDGGDELAAGILQTDVSIS